MGVYIKGMKKPSDCQYCVMYRDGYCGAKGGFCHSEKGVDADCPIVEVVEVNESEIPNSSEKPNNCETCRHNKLEWYSEVCDGCSKAHSNYEPKTEPLDKDTNVRGKDCETCRYESLESYEGACDDCTDISGSPSNYEPKTEPQTDCAWKGEES